MLHVLAVRHVVHVLTVADSLVFLRGQAAFMRDRGWKMSVITSPSDALESFRSDTGVGAYGIEMSRSITPAKDAISLIRLTDTLRQLKPDLVHAHTPKGGLLGTTAARLARTPQVLYHMRGMPMATATGHTRALLRIAERTSCSLARRVIAVSHSLRDAAISERLCAPDKITVLAGGSGNGVDASVRFNRDRLPPGTRERIRELWGTGQNTTVVGFLGRFVGDKGIRELAQAWTQVQRSYPDALLVMGGSFEDRDPVDAGTRERLTGDPSVRLLGFVEDTASFYAAIDVLVLPTYREGFPNVLLEAAAMGVATVATRVTGCVDAVVDGVTGTLVEARNAEALAQAIRRYLDDPTLRTLHGLQGRERAIKHFTQTRIWNELANLYDECCSPKEMAC
jgi:glycosyltransferase involved in cell wall biosynthesis